MKCYAVNDGVKENDVSYSLQTIAMKNNLYPEEAIWVVGWLRWWGGGIPLNNIKSSPPLTSCGLYLFEKYKRLATSFTTVEEHEIDA